VSIAESGIYYDPYDFEIDVDPYPLWKRMRDEAPLYYNEPYDFYALSRFEDVEKGLLDWRTLISGRGMVLELIRANIEFPPGNILFEDPPIHDAHRGILSRAFTPRKMKGLEQQIRDYCARTLDPHVGSDGFDFIADIGAPMPMRVIFMLLGVPEQDQQVLRNEIDDSLRLQEGAPREDQFSGVLEKSAEMFEAYLEYRREHPSDDIMTQLLTTEIEDDGRRRLLTREEVLTYVQNIASAGNETTTRLIGWMGKLLAEHPDQLRQVAEDRSLIPQAVEEILRFEAPSPIQSRYVAADIELHGQVVPEGSIISLLNGSANRDERQFGPTAGEFDIHRRAGHHLSFGYGIHFCLGANLARLEGRIALDEVLNRWSSWEVDYENAEQARTSTVRGWEKLPVRTG
jgi:cytochrome P450